MAINPFYEYRLIEEADKYVNSLNDLVNKKLWGEFTSEEISHANFGVRFNDPTKSSLEDIKDSWGFDLPYGAVVEKVEIRVDDLSKIVYLNKEREMTTKFKAGDKVIRTGWYGGFNPNMKLGEVYEVKGYQNDGLMLLIKGLAGLYDDRAFELFIETPQVDFKNMKFRVSSPEHSKEIQEALFEMGFCWRSHGCEVRFADSFPPCDYLYTDKEGHLWRIDSGEDYLVSSFISAQEHTIETTKSYKLIPVESPKEIITIDGKTYDKEAVLKRLAELEEVE